MNNIGIWLFSVVVVTVFFNLVVLTFVGLVSFLAWDSFLFEQWMGSWSDYFDIFRITLVFGIIFGTAMYNDVK